MTERPTQANTVEASGKGCEIQGDLSNGDVSQESSSQRADRGTEAGKIADILC